jgi:homoserine kinase
LGVALCVPNFEVSTDAARAMLPALIPHGDAVFGLGHLAFLVAGLITGDLEAIALGLADRVHQPYRARLIGPVDDVIAAASRHGALGGFISGSGSTLAALVPPDASPADVGRAMLRVLVDAGREGVAIATAPSSLGATVEEGHD